jgi:protein AFG1
MEGDCKVNTKFKAKRGSALHLQKLYDVLKDYEPATEYKQRLQRLNQTLATSHKNDLTEEAKSIGSRGIWTSLLAKKEKRDSLALTKILTNHEEAMQLASPRGLMLHGEVGTGKSMLIDLFADSLPTNKKKRWHFNTFMLEAFSRLEQLRRTRLSRSTEIGVEEHSMLWLARDLINTSPILFLDEFQLPDRTASRIMTSLMTSFFQLGGVLIATSNRMPDELAKAAGMEFAPPAQSRSLGWASKQLYVRRNSAASLPGQAGEFAMFLELLKARCEVWEMDGGKDYRRSEHELDTVKTARQAVIEDSLRIGVVILGKDLRETTDITENSENEFPGRPWHYYLHDAGSCASDIQDFKKAQLDSISNPAIPSSDAIPWTPSTLKVYGRNVFIPRTYKGVSSWTFAELCATSFGPADYISLSSSYHTFVLTDVPILSSLLKNEARRFITLLDALYEARCRLLISAAAAPDDLFFPETRQSSESENQGGAEQDAVYSETFSDMHQDLTAPFRPNISSYNSQMADDALEDDPPNRARRAAGISESDFNESLGAAHYEVRHSPNFSLGSTFIGEDEKFAYKRATSRLWEMCSRKWWANPTKEFWRPLPKDFRRWEGSIAEVFGRVEASEEEGAFDRMEKGIVVPGEGMGEAKDMDEQRAEVMFRHNASPFRTATEPPPKFSWTHVWGTTKWGKKAGAWGQGVDGLKYKKKPDSGR